MKHKLIEESVPLSADSSFASRLTKVLIKVKLLDHLYNYIKNGLKNA